MKKLMLLLSLVFVSLSSSAQLRLISLEQNPYEITKRPKLNYFQSSMLSGLEEGFVEKGLKRKVGFNDERNVLIIKFLEPVRSVEFSDFKNQILEDFASPQFMGLSALDAARTIGIKKIVLVTEEFGTIIISK